MEQQINQNIVTAIHNHLKAINAMHLSCRLLAPPNKSNQSLSIPLTLDITTSRYHERRLHWLSFECWSEHQSMWFFFFIKTIMGNTSHRVRLTFADYNVKFIGFQSNHLTHHTKSCKINHVKWYFHFSLELICHFGWKRLYLLRAWFTRKVPVFHASNLNGRFGSPLSLILRAQAEKTNFLLSIFMIAIKSDSQREWVSHPPCPILHHFDS